MAYLIQAHNNLTGMISEKEIKRPSTQKGWEQQASRLMQAMQDMSDDDFEGYIELRDVTHGRPGRLVHKMSVGWPAQEGR